MASSPLLRLIAFFALFLAVLGCQPSNNPTNGDNKLYTDMTFTMEDVNLNVRWTGGGGSMPPQTRLPPKIQIEKDITLFVNGILGEFKLPQDMVSVSVDANNVLTEKLSATLIPDGENKGKCNNKGYAYNTEEIMVTCSDMSNATPVEVQFTITGKFKAHMGATQAMWDTLAENLKEQLDDYGYVQFNGKDLTVEPTSST